MSQQRNSVILIRLLVPMFLVSSCSIFPKQRNLSSSETSGITQRLDTMSEESTGPLVLRPVRADGPERLLIVVPGMKRPPAEYVSLVRSIQEKSPHRLWVGILKFTAELVNPHQVDAGIEQVFSNVRELGFASVGPEQTIVAGHSMGGIIAQKYVQDKKYAGLVLLSSYLVRTNERSSLPDMHLPVLTLTGELDGQTRVTRIALDAKSSFDLANAADAKQILAEKPVVVLPGVNHAQFADGKRIPEDLEPEHDYNTAQSEIARVVSDFMIMNDTTSLLNDDKVRAFERMSAAVEKTKEIVEPYWAALEKDVTWCSEAQAEEASPLPASIQLKIDAEKSDDLGSFAASKPKATLKPNGELELSITYNLTYPHNFLDISNIPESARALSCKTKSREAIRSLTGLDQAPALACADLNKKIFNWAIDKVRPEVSQRFLRRGRTMVFADDREFASGIQWLPSKLQIEKNPNSREATVTSTALRSGLNVPAMLAGMHYCKLLPPTQVMEWILLEGLRD